MKKTVSFEQQFWHLNKEDALSSLSASLDGLTSENARERLDKYGKNTLKDSTETLGLLLFLRQFKSPITLLLIAAAILSAFLGDIPDTLIIFVIVLISNFLSYWQERGAASAVKELLKIVQLRCTILRDKQKQELPFEMVVLGDIVYVSAGDIIPGDALLLDFLTTEIGMDGFRKGMNLGADDYIIKPFNCTDLLSSIEVKLKKYELTKNNFEGENQYHSWQEKKKQPKELNNLFENGLAKQYNKKDYLFTIGESQHYLHFITKGEVKVSNTNENGKEMIFKLVGAKQFVGHKSLMNGSVYIEDAVALTPTEARLIKTNDFLQLIYCNREIAKWFINCLSYDLIQAEKRLHNLAYQSVRQKVAAALVDVCEHQNLVSKGNSFIALSRKNLAAIVGTALETLNRTILDFRKEGIVEIIPLGIRILQMNKLEQISQQ